MGKRQRYPLTKKKNASGENNNFRYAMSAMQGWRKSMEDTHRVSLSIRTRMKDWAFAGVFDGHGGKKASAYASKHLLNKILKNIPASNAASTNTMNMSEIQKQRGTKEGITSGFLKLDTIMSKSKKTNDGSGTTAVCVFVSPSHYYIANCGDSRAILCRDEKVHFATKDHKPTCKSEKTRIESAGGKVEGKRVEGILALSRALGDFEFKNNINKGQCDQMVSPQPEITVIKRNFQRDQFVVLACDGVFDVMSNSELITFIRGQMGNNKSLKEVCNKVADRCLAKGSHDNISIIILALPGCPSQSAMIRKRKLGFEEMNKTIRCKKARTQGTNISGASLNPKSNRNTLNLQSTTKLGIASSSLNLSGKRHQKTLNKNWTCLKAKHRHTNAFIAYFLNYWKKQGGNICKTAKVCGEKWNRLSLAQKRHYKIRMCSNVKKRNMK